MRQYKSRLNQVEEQKSIRSAVMFGGLTILVVVLLIFFGLKLFPKFTNLFVNKSVETTNDEVNLVAPSLQSIPENTNSQSIIVKGYSQPNSNVKVYFNSSSDTTSVDDSGNFSINVSLIKGENKIYAVTVDDKDNESEKSTIYTVNYSNQIPNLTVSNPQNNQSYYGSSQQNITVEGLTDKGNSVTVNDHIAIVDGNGKFTLPISLQDGENTIKVVSLSDAGNKKEIELKITYNP